MHGCAGFGCSIWRKDDEAVGLGGGGEVAGALPGDAADWGAVPLGVKMGGEKAGDIGCGLCVDEGGLCEARCAAGFAGEGAENGRGEEQEGDHGGDGVAGKSEEGERGGIWCARRELAKDGGLAGLNADAGEVEGGPALGEGLLDEVVFAGGDASGEEQQVAGFLCSVE